MLSFGAEDIASNNIRERTSCDLEILIFFILPKLNAKVCCRAHGRDFDFLRRIYYVTRHLLFVSLWRYSMLSMHIFLKNVKKSHIYKIGWPKKARTADHKVQLWLQSSLHIAQFVDHILARRGFVTSKKYGFLHHQKLNFLYYLVAKYLDIYYIREIDWKQAILFYECLIVLAIALKTASNISANVF